MATEPILSVRDLQVKFHTDDGLVDAVNGVSFDVFPGETLGIVGESGSGKSVSVMSMLGLIPTPPGEITGGEALLDGVDLLKLSERRMRRLRGDKISMIFQDPMTSLNPVMKIGRQISEVMEVHGKGGNAASLKQRAIELLKMVGIPQAEQRAEQYPFEFSGGMRQRAMTALAMANDPRLLIADEPTTALDVTIQAQVLDTITEVKETTDAALILITHDLGLIAEMVERVVVMYAGRVVETGPIEDVFERPKHPYTLGLLKSIPSLVGDRELTDPIPGQPPDLTQMPPGCAFHPRCALGSGRAACFEERPTLDPAGADGQYAACHFADEVEPFTVTGQR